MKSKSQFLKTTAALAAFTVFSFTVSAQGLRGSVKDQSGEPIIGATVLVDGQTGGAVTDIDGNFTINAKPGTKLHITYVGFSPQDVTARQA